MTKAEDFFIKLTGEIPDTKPGKMFGALCMKTGSGKSAAMFWNENIVVKLHADTMQQAMTLKGAQPFEPMEGRPMKEWVQIPFKYKKEWKKYALISAENVKQFPKVPPKKNSLHV